LAAKAKKIGMKHLETIATLATPRTLLDWHQRLIGVKAPLCASEIASEPHGGQFRSANSSR
jgi:hypothetical protein